MIACGTARHHSPAALGRGDTVRRILDRQGVARFDSQRRARVQVGVGCRLRRDAVTEARDAPEAFEQTETLEVRLHPIAWRARRDREWQAQRVGLVEPLAHAGTRHLAREQLVAAGPAPLVHGVLVDRTRRALLQQGDHVEPAHGADLGRPLLHRQRRAAVRVEHLSPHGEDGALGVEDHSVEVEHHRPDHGSQR